MPLIGAAQATMTVSVMARVGVSALAAGAHRLPLRLAGRRRDEKETR